MARLTLLAFPQEWDGAGTLSVRILALPNGDPYAPLDLAAAPPFATTDLEIEARFVTGTGSLPVTTDTVQAQSLGVLPRPNREVLFDQLRTLFTIVAKPPAVPLAAAPAIRKLLTATYLAAAGVTRPRTPFAVTDDRYRCAIEDAPAPKPLPPPDPTVTWGQALAYALRQPKLAEQLGVLFLADLAVPPGISAVGGWLYAGLAAGSPYAALPSPGVVASYAARIPKLSGRRPVFAAVLFPVLTVAGGGYDTVFAEASSYDDGFGKVVHAAQPVSSGTIDTEPGTLPPARDLGIRLGWDDEQQTVWMNRQLGTDPFTGGPSPVAARMGVRAGRIDVRETGTQVWTSLNTVQGDVALGPIDLGAVTTELGVEAVPVSLGARFAGDYWLPPYLARWAGGSVVLSDPVTYLLTDQAPAKPKPFTAVGADLPLLYGHEYEFRVRYMDLSGGGPVSADDTPETVTTAVRRFRRHVPPRPVTVRPGGGLDADGRHATYRLDRPRLGYPDAVFTGAAGALADLLADRDAQLARAALDPAAPTEEVGIPDPDVVAVEVTVAARGLDGDPAAPDGYQPLFTCTRPFPAAPGDPLDLTFDVLDRAHVADLPDPGADGPIPLPSARYLRLSLVALAKDDPTLTYFGSEAARRSHVAVPISLRTAAAAEAACVVPQPAAQQFQALFLQPDPAGVAGRIANQLGLSSSGLSLGGRPGERTVLGCSGALRHTLSPDAATVTFATATDLALHWIIAVRLEIDRDWTWQGAGAPSFELIRDGHGVVTTATLPPAIGHTALDPASGGPDRTRTRLVLLDAIDPKPSPGVPPAELHETYSVHVRYRDPAPAGDDTWSWTVRLPIACPPVQTAKLVSAGFAASPYEAAPDYSSTAPRSRRLWLELESPPMDAQDQVFGRVLAYAPDQLLLAPWDDPIAEPPEPPLPVDPEPLRVITPGQDKDDSGIDAMQPLERASGGGNEYLVPLPPGVDETSLELLGMYTYELRIGHDRSRWSTAMGRFGPPLRVAGVQHPPPPISVQATRAETMITVASPFATPVDAGRNLRPRRPQTDLWALFYAQVAQLDGATNRNVLLLRRQLQWQDPRRDFDDLHGRSLLELGVAVVEEAELSSVLDSLGLPRDSGLSVVVVELIGQPYADADGRPRRDPLGVYLGDMRVLRTSSLTQVADHCVPMP
ncbi:MAG: hypothetical protein ACXV5Q_03080 [Frankiaceae bacterium]